MFISTYTTDIIVFNQRLTSQKLYGPVGFLPQLPLMRMPAPPLTPILAA
jgi:hypothetical protein